MIDSRFYKNNGPFSLKQICEICSATLQDESNADVMINDLASIAKGGEGEICFFFDKKKKDAAAQIKTTACVTSKDFVGLIPAGVAVLMCENPHDGFVKLNRAMYSEILPQAQISDKAVKTQLPTFIELKTLLSQGCHSVTFHELLIIII